MNEQLITINVPFGLIRKVRRPSTTAKNQGVTYFEVVTLTGGDMPCSTSKYSFEDLEGIAQRQVPLHMTLAVTFGTYDNRLTMKVDEMALAEYGAVPAAQPERKQKAS